MCMNNECITKNALFSKIILDEDILKITRQYMISKTKKKTKKISLQSATMENKAWRYICYKQFTLWVNSWMPIGRGNRVVIPACVVKKIRERYPEENGLYIGFQNQ
ncbi:P2X purinoceptor 7-like [Aphis gossypii]|uniref:P2X purinoceptor 7-like n=1 Tax=Aphis gossypii TaxID=80765 RepID=UPI00215966F4|nr:P2X purinoceptor 7-like [Aphis gossypii]